MRRRILLLALNSLLFLTVVAVLLHQHRTSLALRHAIDRERTQAHEAQRLTEQNQHLRSTLPAADELAELRADHDALPALQQEVAALEARVQERLRTDAPPPPAEPAARAIFPSSSWFNAGRETPVHTIMTALWAASRSDVAALQETLQLDAQGERRLQAMWSELPAEQRARYPDQQAFVAALAAQNIFSELLEFVEFDDHQSEDAPFATLRVRVTDHEGAERFPTLVTLRGPDGWKLLLPTRVLENYYAELTAPASAPH